MIPSPEEVFGYSMEGDNSDTQKREDEKKSEEEKPKGQHEQSSEEEEEDNTKVDLGAMGWKFCKRPIRKIQTNRFGRKGTRSRCLMRAATSLDVLDIRPTSWPKPPPGFTTKRVLGPGSDFARGNGGKRRRSRSNKRRKKNNDNNDAMDVEGGSEEQEDNGSVPALDKGLKSSRAGFSVEEME